ncbi:MAG: GGDEF domain-containing protein [Bdellovibrionota bacterium]
MWKDKLQPVAAGLAIVVLPVVFIAFNQTALDSHTRRSIQDLVFILPYLLLGLSGFLGFRLGQRRILFICLLFATCYAYAQSQGLPFWPQFGFRVKTRVIAIALPLSLCALFFTKEGRLFSLRGLAQMMATFLPLTALTVGLHFKWQAIRTLVHLQLSPQIGFLHLPDLAVLSGLVFMVISLVSRERYLRGISIFSATALLPLFYIIQRTSILSSNAGRLQLELGVGFISVASLILYAILRLYWQRIYLDELTGIPNRRALNEKLTTLNRRYAIAMVDIDHFKKFNDTYGHEEGDRVLCLVAQHLENESNGLAFRYGGEEFTLVFEHTDPQAAVEKMDLIRQKLAEKEFFITSPKDSSSSNSSSRVQLTISVGISNESVVRRTADEVLSAADKALYQAKAKGRNCVAVA